MKRSRRVLQHEDAPERREGRQMNYILNLLADILLWAIILVPLAFFVKMSWDEVRRNKYRVLPNEDNFEGETWRQFAAGLDRQRMEKDAQITTLRDQVEKLKGFLQEVLDSGVEFADERISYESRQLKVGLLEEIREALRRVLV